MSQGRGIDFELFTALGILFLTERPHSEHRLPSAPLETSGESSWACPSPWNRPPFPAAANVQWAKAWARTSPLHFVRVFQRWLQARPGLILSPVANRSVVA